MRFYYTCTYGPRRISRLETANFDNHEAFVSYLDSLNKVAPGVFAYTEDTPMKLLTDQWQYPPATGSIDWLQVQAQRLWRVHKELGNAEATNYLLRIILEFNKGANDAV